MSAKAQRYVFTKDDDGHDFMIPVELESEFKSWLKEDAESEDFDPDKYSEYAIDGHRYSFTDPRQDI